MEALFRAYFTEGRDIGHTPTLLDVVAGAGLDRGQAEANLKDSDGIEAIRKGEKQAQTSGVRGVPFFLVNKEFALSGAQDASAFLAAFDQAGGESPTTNERSVCKVGAGEEPSC